MFWDSVVTSLNVFTYWETYVAGLVYVAISFAPAVAAAEGRFVPTKGYLGILVIPALQVVQIVAVVVFVLTLSPIIFGFDTDAAWSFPWVVMTQAPAVFFKLIMLLVVTGLVLVFIPVIKHLDSLHTLIIGGMALAFTLELINAIDPGTIQGQIEYLPGLWFSVGLLVVGSVMTYIGMMVAAIIMTVFDYRTRDVITQEMEMGSLTRLFGAISGAIFGFIPVFIYGAWLGHQI